MNDYSGKGFQNVMPANAGIHMPLQCTVSKWIPAFAGMTKSCFMNYSG